jgi:hypothetical protein
MQRFINWRNMKLFLHKGSCVHSVSKGYVLNTAQTQRKVIHSVSHSALKVLNILMGIGYIMEWCPHIIRIIYTLLKLHLPDCIQPKQRLAPPSPTTLHSPNFSEPSTDSLLLPETLFNFSITADSNIVQSPLSVLFSSLLVYNQILMQATDNKSFMEGEIFLTS